MRRVVLNVACILVSVASVIAVCPHDEAGLQLFSASGLGNGLTIETDLVISTGIRLDVDLDVNTITVNSTGKLVFEPGQDIVVRTRSIMVEGDAELWIGSDSCRFVEKVNIYLKGDRTTSVSRSMHEGEKFIAVKDNGVLQLHGLEKRPWTKLGATVDRFATSMAADEYLHSTSDMSTTGAGHQGLTLYIFNSTFDRLLYDTYDFLKTTQSSEQDQVDEITAKLDEITTGQLVAISVQNQWTWTTGTNVSALLTKIEDVASMGYETLLLRTAQILDSFALVFVKDGAFDQAFDPLIAKDETRAVASIEYNNKKISAISYIKDGKSWKSGIDLSILNLDNVCFDVTVIDDISSWLPGNEVLFTSTDYAWSHGEVRRITEITSPFSFKIDVALDYRHFGEIEHRVDMRGEVALLTRNIKIQGEMSRGCPTNNDNCAGDIDFDTFGGHIKILHSFQSIFIQGVELQFMGQASVKGFYPIHFHMCLDVTDKVAILKSNSIHDTFARAITIHGTYGSNKTHVGVEVIGNVAYNVFGHCYFLEDGAEVATILHGNLGAAVKNIDNGFDTDRNKATIFWITNPKTEMVGNVGAGADGFCIWYVFPESPVGPSSVTTVYQYREAQHTPLWRFDSNVVHSCDRGGMNFDNILDNEDGFVSGCMNYESFEDPLNTDSKHVKNQLTRLIAFKNRMINTWLRGGWFELMQYSSAESIRGLQLARGSSQQQFVKKSVFIGRSSGNFEDASYPDAVVGADLKHYIGVVFYDGPVYIDSSYFIGFSNDSNGDYVSGALGFKPRNIFSSSAASSVSNLKFGYSDASSGNRVFDGNFNDEDLGFGNLSGDETATFRDTDGSVTQCPADTNWQGPVQVVKPEKFLLTERCSYRDNWQVAICRDMYGKIKVEVKDTFTTFNGTGQMKRVRYDDAKSIAFEDHAGEVASEYMVILNSTEYYYEFQFTQGFPKKFTVEGKGIERDMPVVIGICLPSGTTRDNIIISSKTKEAVIYDDTFMKSVSSLEAVAGATITNKYYLTGRMLYFKLDTWVPRTLGWDRRDTNHCPSDCPKFTLELDQEMAYTPCVVATAEQLSTDIYLTNITQHDCELPSSIPDADWGAGAMLESQDGKWGEWSSWADCCDATNNPLATTTRYRLCDAPPKFGDGADCEGSSEEVDDCTASCPVNGVLTEWAIWSDCFCDGEAVGSFGAQTRSKDCLNQANYGMACDGYVLDQRDCEAGCEFEP